MEQHGAETYQMANFAKGTISTDHELEARRRCTVCKVYNNVVVGVSMGVDYRLIVGNPPLGDGGHEHVSELPSVDLGGIAALAKGEDLFAMHVIQQVDCGIAVPRVLLELVEHTSLLHGTLATTDVKVEAASPRVAIFRAPLIHDVIPTLLLEKSRKSEAGGPATDNCDFGRHL